MTIESKIETKFSPSRTSLHIGIIYQSATQVLRRTASSEMPRRDAKIKTECPTTYVQFAVNAIDLDSLASPSRALVTCIDSRNCQKTKYFHEMSHFRSLLGGFLKLYSVLRFSSSGYRFLQGQKLWLMQEQPYRCLETSDSTRYSGDDGQGSFRRERQALGPRRR